MVTPLLVEDVLCDSDWNSQLWCGCWVFIEVGVELVLQVPPVFFGTCGVEGVWEAFHCEGRADGAQRILN